MFNFSDRPAKVDPECLIGGERPGAVYHIGTHKVTVYVDGEVTIHRPREYQGDPRRTLPNMEIIDGQVRIALEDLIDEILARIEPEELAATMWRNDDVRARFMDALADRWSQDGVGDDDRREFVGKVKDTIHDQALDDLARAMAKMECQFSTSYSCWREIREANETLYANDARGTDGEPLRLKDPSAYGEFSIGGGAWSEAREHWRHEVRQFFPAPDGEGRA